MVLLCRWRGGGGLSFEFSASILVGLTTTAVVEAAGDGSPGGPWLSINCLKGVLLDNI